MLVDRSLPYDSKVYLCAALVHENKGVHDGTLAIKKLTKSEFNYANTNPYTKLRNYYVCYLHFLDNEDLNTKQAYSSEGINYEC